MVSQAWLRHNQYLRQEALDSFFLLEDHIHIAFGRRWRVVFSGPLNADGTKLSKSLNQTVLSDIPGDTAEEDLARIDRVFVSAGRELTRPEAASVRVGSTAAVKLCCFIKICVILRI